jgi:negative regulator of flagellin synthesis FlgM
MYQADGGFTMSYSNGIGNLQYLLGTLAAPASTETKRPATTTGDGGVDASSTNARGADSTLLSSAAGLVSAATQIPDVRTALVASLQATIAAGTYSVSSSDVAGKMIQSMLG